jgi:hypothetical protein
MVFDTTPQGLLNLLNHGAGLAVPNGGFPQIGGVRSPTIRTCRWDSASSTWR